MRNGSPAGHIYDYVKSTFIISHSPAARAPRTRWFGRRGTSRA